MIVRLPNGTFWESGPDRHKPKSAARCPDPALVAQLRRAMRDVGAPETCMRRNANGHLYRDAESVAWRVKLWLYMHGTMRMSYAAIGRASGCRHTSVMHAVAREADR